MNRMLFKKRITKVTFLTTRQARKDFATIEAGRMLRTFDVVIVNQYMKSSEVSVVGTDVMAAM